MNKYIIGIDGMRCGMCEMHVEEVVRKNIKIKKAKASRFKNQLVVITELDLIKEDFLKVIDPTGYKITSFEKLEAKHSLFGWK